MQAEASYWISRQVPNDVTSEPIPLNGYGTVLDIVTGITSRVMIGLPTCRVDNWLAIAKGYSVEVMNVSTSLRPYPAFLRPFAYPWQASVKRLRVHVQNAKECLVPVFAARTENTNGKFLDMAQWMVDSARGTDRNPEVLTLKMLFLTLASVHTSSMTVTHALFDLCAMPEYVQQLREEVREIVGKYGWTREGIHKLKKLDSFLKESQRMNHPGLCKLQNSSL